MTASYLGLMIIMSLIFLGIGIYLTVSKKNPVVGKILIILPLSAGIIYGALFGSLLLLFSSVDGPVYSILLLIFSALIIILLICGLFGLLKKKTVKIFVFSGIGIYIAVTAGILGYNTYINSIPKVAENSNILMEYTPYIPNTKVVNLEEDSTLKIASDFPVMDGATALYPIYSSFAKAVYPKEVLSDTSAQTETAPVIKRADVLKCSRTDVAYRHIVTGDADIIFCAAPSKEQEAFAKENGVELIYTPIGKEAFVFFVNSKNPIDDISLENVQNIYSGEITQWEQLGIKSIGNIKAFQRPEGSGSQSALIRLMDGKELTKPIEEEVIGGMGGIIEKTADYKNHKNAIGYSFRFYSTEMVKNNQIKLLSINGIYPNIENIENGTYPIASYFYAVTRSDASDNTKKLLEWIQGNQGQEIIEKVGYTPLK